MRDPTNEILELIRRTSSSLPKDMEERSEELPGRRADGFPWAEPTFPAS